MTGGTDIESSAKRKLILRDALTFLSLTLLTAILFAMTLFLFRSFASHREDLAKRWSDRGLAAISSGHPDQAIIALRTALSYAPGERSYELLLAQALGDAGYTDESYNYFLGLWETQPGDGLINLSLARLAARKNDTQAATNYYRASIYGTWEGDGIVRRRDVRLELARYMIAHHDLNDARTEILVAGGNAPGDVTLTLQLAQLLEQAGAPHDAFNYYKKILAREPDNDAALQAAGRLSYGFGDYESAEHLLAEVGRDHLARGSDIPPLSPELQRMLDNSIEIQALSPLKKLQPEERVARILKARNLARERFESCNAQIATASGLTLPLQTLGARWTGKEATVERSKLLHNIAEQDAVVQLIYDTETQTNQICGAPTGDDALLLLIAQSAKGTDQ